MSGRLSVLVPAIACLLTLSAAAFGGLPSPTYGWNLGNTLEPPCGEGCWGPAATQALIDAVADAGFNTVRLPCAWDSHANQTTYAIDPAYMARVKQVADWCLARNLYVIINCHWDNGWLERHITETVDPTINAKQHAYWTQIANAFVDYDERLLFAGCNEPDVETAAQMATLLVYEQTFVSAVRAAGGCNTSRWLVVQGPCTDMDRTDALMNTLPADPTPGRLMVEVHYYAPYNFVMMTQDEWWGNQFFYWGEGYHSVTDAAHNPTWGEEDYMAAQFLKMKTKFIDRGIPVILGEFGAMKRTSQLSGADLDLHLRGRTYYHKTVVDCANSFGLKPVFWDIDGVTFNWTTGAKVDPDNIRALTGGAALPPPSADTTPPSAPTGLTVNLDGINAALDWNDNTEADLAGYNVYRSTTSGGGYVKLNTSPVAGSDYTDDTTVGGKTYYYRVRAVDTSWNESGDSNEATAFTPMIAMGRVLREWWTGLGSGQSVSGLTSAPAYPDNPSGSELLSRLEGPVDWDERYGTRIRGYVHPPATGSYTFWIAGDDNCQLWLSTDGTPAHAALIAYVPDWTNSREWNKYPEQPSVPVSLTAGRKYYIEVLHKEGTGGDNIAVAWTGPGISQAVIDGAYLSPWRSGTAGDWNNSGAVGLDDLEVLAGIWLQEDCVLTSAIDFNGDCVVDLYEFAETARNWPAN